jgi:hypothetical protein
VTSGEELVLELGHEHGFHQRRDARDGPALQRHGFKLEQDVIGFPEPPIVSAVGFDRGEGR